MSGGVITAAWIQGLCTLIPTTVLAVVAVRGLRAWRPQAQGQRALDRAEDCLVTLHEVVDLTRAARARSFSTAAEDVDTPEKMRETSARIREEALQRAWQSWQRFAAAYRRTGFFIALPKPNAAEELAKALTELSSLSRIIDVYEPLEEDRTSHGHRFREEAVAARSRFLGLGGDGLKEDPEDPIEMTLTSVTASLEAILLHHTGGGDAPPGPTGVGAGSGRRAWWLPFRT